MRPGSPEASAYLDRIVVGGHRDQPAGMGEIRPVGNAGEPHHPGTPIAHPGRRRPGCGDLSNRRRSNRSPGRRVFGRLWIFVRARLGGRVLDYALLVADPIGTE
ncbi:hypothetical protein NJB1507_05910 [Mycobacterium marinum]|nr:hypothetical protein NJB1507_05910 [Mycobacterium marinum]